MCRVACFAERLEVCGARTIWHGIRHIGDRLRRLANWHRGHDPVRLAVSITASLSSFSSPT